MLPTFMPALKGAREGIKSRRAAPSGKSAKHGADKRHRTCKLHRALLIILWLGSVFQFLQMSASLYRGHQLLHFPVAQRLGRRFACLELFFLVGLQSLQLIHAFHKPGLERRLRSKCRGTSTGWISLGLLRRINGRIDIGAAVLIAGVAL